MKPLYIVILLLVVVAISVADVLFKQAAKSGDFMMALRTPWFWGGVVLYLFQVFVFTYLFTMGVPLTVIIGIVQTASYAIVVLGAGFFFLMKY